MVKLVLLHKAESIYDDEPDRVDDFPKSYLKPVSEGVGDWIVYSEPVKAGRRGYFAVARIARVIPKPGAPGRYLALIAPGSYPTRRTWTMPLITRRSSTRRAPGWFLGSKGSIAAQARSESQNPLDIITSRDIRRK